MAIPRVLGTIPPSLGCTLLSDYHRLTPAVPVAPRSCSSTDEIGEYFGIKIGIYFAWLGHYTRSLILPSLIGVIYWVSSLQQQVRSRS